MPTQKPTSAPNETNLVELLGPLLASSLTTKGYTALTPVQARVLDPKLSGRDLRISSQTGSGKTLAIGFVLRDVASAATAAGSKSAPPRALVIVPTRELAHQVYEELSWLYAPLKLRISSVAGGASYRDEHRNLSQGPAIVVGTPGRLLDHLKRGSVDASQVAAVVLDEADRMLDLGFREELEAILAHTPPEHRTHLVSATFARDVAALADRIQKDPVRIEGTPLGSANADIDHILYLVSPRERVDALINVLLHHPDEQTLVFAKTRADVAEITAQLQQAGFAAGALSGEMEQQARNRALGAFKRGETRALVATDVAARGIDVQDIARVVQVDPLSNAETYTHRSGRTGRAGRKGTSALLVPPSALNRTAAVLQRLNVRFRIEPVPTAKAIRQAQDERWIAELTAENELEIPKRITEQVARIMEGGHAERALGYLLSRLQKTLGEPREVTVMSQGQDRGRRGERDRFGQREQFEPRTRHTERPPAYGDQPRRSTEQWVPFRISWGTDQGADARRLVAMLCRRGNISGQDLGAIRISASSSTVDVSERVARAFAEATREPDPRDPRVTVMPMAAPQAGSRPEASERAPYSAKKPERETAAPYGRGPDHKAGQGKAPYAKPAYGKAAHAKPPYGKPAYDKPAYAKSKPEKPAYAKSAPSAPAAPKRNAEPSARSGVVRDAPPKRKKKHKA